MVEFKLSVLTTIYIAVTLVIPIVFLGCLSPLYMAVDRVRSGQQEERPFYNRWLYNGSTETGVCALSLGLMLSFGTSQRPSNYYLAQTPTAHIHNLEMFALGLSLLFILIISMAILFRYGLHKQGENYPKRLISASLATITLFPPAIFYFIFRMEWTYI